MVRGKLPPEIETLSARIETVMRSYYISELQREPGNRCIDDEAIVEMRARIERISPRLKEHIGGELQVMLVCARRYRQDSLPEGRPFLASLNLRGDQRSILAYLPPEPFWGMPTLIEANRCYMEARFERVRYGRGTLHSLFFGPAEKVFEFD